MRRILLISMGFLPMLVFALQAQPDSLKQYHLRPVRVIADGPQASIGAVQSILNPPNVESVSESIKHGPGITMSYGSRDESNLMIRGFRKTENLILLDGRPLNSGYFGNVDLSKILTDDIAEIRIVKGPASALYGSSTMGGVVNLITRKDDHYLSVESKVSSNWTNSLRLSSARSFGDFRIKLSMMREERQAFPLSKNFSPTVFENGELRNHSYQESWHGDLNMDWLLGDMHELSISSGVSLIPYKEIPSSIYSWNYATYQDWYRASTGISFDYFSSLNSNLRGQLYFDAAGDTYERFRDSAHQNLELSSRMESINFGFAPVFELRRNGTLNSGSRIELRRVNRKDNNYYAEWTDNHALVGMVFSQYERALSTTLNLSVSAGLSFFNHSQNEDLEFQPEPSFALNYNHSDNSSTMLSAGINSSVPTMRQLFSAENGNPYLKAAIASKYELNHKRNLGSNCFLDLSIFYNDVSDLIDRIGSQYINVYQVQTYGGEGSLNASFLGFWDTHLQYSLLKQRGDYVVSEIVPHSVTFNNEFKLPHGFRLQGLSVFNSKRKSRDSVDRLRTLEPHFVQDLSLLATYRKLEVSLSMQNIFDLDYQSEYGYPAPGRSFSLRLKYVLR